MFNPSSDVQDSVTLPTGSSRGIIFFNPSDIPWILSLFKVNLSVKAGVNSNCLAFSKSILFASIISSASSISSDAISFNTLFLVSVSIVFSSSAARRAFLPISLSTLQE